MATREMQLISRILRTGCLSEVLEWGIGQEDFLTNEGRAMFNHMLGYYTQANTTGSVIGLQLAASFYPNFQVCDDPLMTTTALCHEVRQSRLLVQLKAYATKIIEGADENLIGAANYLQKLGTDVLNLSMHKATDVQFTNAIDTMISKYEMKEAGIDTACGRWPWQPMDEASDGIQPDDYVVFYGRPKSMKSWVLAYLIAWIFDCGKRAIIYTKEMTPDNIFTRVAACILKLPYQELRTARLTPEQKNQLYILRQMIRSIPGEQLITLSGKDAPNGGDTVPWLRSKVELYKPDFVFIDGLYLMSDVSGSKKREERITSISRAIRQMVLDYKVPAIATLQANRAAAKNEDANLDEIAYSDAIAQDATFLIRVINEKNKPTIQLVIGGSREFYLNGIRIKGNPATDFTFDSLLTEKEIQNARANDTGSDDNPQAHAMRRRRGNGADASPEAQAAGENIQLRVDEMMSNGHS